MRRSDVVSCLVFVRSDAMAASRFEFEVITGAAHGKGRGGGERCMREITSGVDASSKQVDNGIEDKNGRQRLNNLPAREGNVATSERATILHARRPILSSLFRS